MPDASQSTNTLVSQELQKLGTQLDRSLYSKMSREEHNAVIEKMVALVAQPVGHLPKQEELYLEQQLTDMLGFQVEAELDGHRLQHSIGVMEAQHHLRRHPTDTLLNHENYREAGLASVRSVFGWFTEQGKMTQLAVQNEKYFFAVQANFVDSWHKQYQDLMAWYKYRKMIVINPTESKAVVGAVGNFGPADWLQKQFGGSPEIIREASIWSLKSRGRVLLFFIDDPKNAVPLGAIDLQKKD